MQWSLEANLKLPKSLLEHCSTVPLVSVTSSADSCFLGLFNALYVVHAGLVLVVSKR